MFYIGGENVRDRGRKCSATGPRFVERIHQTKRRGITAPLLECPLLPSHRVRFRLTVRHKG